MVEKYVLPNSGLGEGSNGGGWIEKWLTKVGKQPGPHGNGGPFMGARVSGWAYL